MSNYIEYNDSIAFHPGYYIQEIIGTSINYWLNLQSTYDALFEASN